MGKFGIGATIRRSNLILYWGAIQKPVRTGPVKITTPPGRRFDSDVTTDTFLRLGNTVETCVLFLLEEPLLASNFNLLRPFVSQKTNDLVLSFPWRLIYFRFYKLLVQQSNSV